MDRQRNGTNGERFNSRPEYQVGKSNVNSPIPSGIPNGIARTQSFSLPSKAKASQTGSCRMYEFKKHKMFGRKPDWEITDRSMIPKTDPELKARIKKPQKDNKGLSSKRDFHNSGMLGYKQKQIQQLIYDLQCNDQRFEWRLELIELHGLVLSSETGKTLCSKMIVILSQNPSRGYAVAPGRTWPLNRAVVDLRPFQKQDVPAYHSAGGQQQRPDVVQTMHEVSPAPHTGQLPRQNIYDNRGPRPTAVYNIQEERGHHESHGILQPGQGKKGKDRNDSRVRPLYNTQDVQGHHQPREVLEPGHNEKGKDKKGGKKGRPASIIEISTPKVYHDNSDSSSDRDSISDAHTFRTSDTEVSIESPTSEKQYFSQKDLKAKRRSEYVPEASREHRRKNPTEYMPQSRGRYGKDDTVVQPASSSRRHRSFYPRSPSFPRDRPFHGREDSFEDHSQRFDESPPRRHDPIFDRGITTRIDFREEVEIERDRNLCLEFENLRLKQDLKARARREEMLRERLERRLRYDDDYRYSLF